MSNEPVNYLEVTEVAASLEAMFNEGPGTGSPTIVMGVTEPSCTMVVHFGNQAFRVVVTEIMH